MPKMCFSYPSETGSRGAVPPVRDSKICFSYTVTHCFRY